MLPVEAGPKTLADEETVALPEPKIFVVGCAPVELLNGVEPNGVAAEAVEVGEKTD